MNSMNSIQTVITGMGCLCAAGADLDASWNNMLAGIQKYNMPTKFYAETNRKSPVFEVSTEKCLKLDLPENRKKEMTDCVYFLLVALEEALKSASLSYADIFGNKIGVCIGTTVGCTLNDEQFYRKFKDGSMPELNAIRRFLSHNPSQYISENLDLKGPVSTINNACSSGTDVIGQAVEWISDGLCDMVIAGGTDELCRIPYLGFSALLNTSKEPCRPFDLNRDGLNLGEGAGVFIVENISKARKRKADILVEIAGYGTCADAFHPTAPHPQGIGLDLAIHKALGQIEIDKISFINAHGTATINNDQVEGRVLSSIFGENVPVFGTKSFTGHTLGASGAMEAIFTALGLLTGNIPPTAGFRETDPKCMITPTNKITAVEGDYAVSTSLAFGGNNSVVLLKVASDAS